MSKIVMMCIMCIIFFVAVASTATVYAADLTMNVSGAYSASNREYGGYGSVSGGLDALLMEYDEPYLTDILNYCFKEGYALELKTLKVEIGGGGNDTTMAVPSHWPEEHKKDYYAGYNWKLIKKVKEINPKVKIIALDWSLPSWVGINDEREAQYIFDWVKGMWEVHGIRIDFVGGQRNEQEPLQPGRTTRLRQLLNDGGFSDVKIIAADSVSIPWAINSTIGSNSSYKDAIDIFGAHYVGGRLYSTVPSNNNLRNTNKPIWESEGGAWHDSFNHNLSGSAIGNGFSKAKAFIAAYVNAKISGFLSWGMTASIYDNSFWYMIGLIRANSPWSGNWSEGGNQVWAVAHINQFADFGWQFIDAAADKQGTNSTNNSVYYAALKAPDNSDYTILVDTIMATDTTKHVLKATVTNGLPTEKSVHVWRSKTKSDSYDDWMVKVETITSAQLNGYTLEPNCIYTFTTTDRGGKGKKFNPIPRRAGISLPVTLDFDDVAAGQKPPYLYDMEGTFVVEEGSGKGGGNALKQVLPAPVTKWVFAAENLYKNNGGNIPIVPYCVFGDPRWRNYRASVDVLMETGGDNDTVSISIRSNSPQESSRNGYHLYIAKNGNWKVTRYTNDGKEREGKLTETTLTSGNVGYALTLGEWYNIAIEADGDKITAYFEGRELGSVTDSTHKMGNIFLFVSSFRGARFDNLRIERPDPAKNLALGKPTTASSDCGGADWAANQRAVNATDGIRNSGDNGWHAQYQGQLTQEWLMVDLGSATIVNSIDIYPRWEGGGKGIGQFPKNFSLQVSSDGSSWKNVVAKKNYVISDLAKQRFDFNDVSARYVRLLIERSGMVDDPAIAEIEVYHRILSNNFALNQPAWVSSSAGVEFTGNWGWNEGGLGARYAVDGVDGRIGSGDQVGYSEGWSSYYLNGQDGSGYNDEWFMVDIGPNHLINRVDIYPLLSTAGELQNKFPKNFRIEVSNDKENWTTALTVSDYIPSDQRAQVFTFDTVRARYVRLYATVDGRWVPHDNIGFSEFEVYGPLDQRYISESSGIEVAVDSGNLAAGKPTTTNAEGVVTGSVDNVDMLTATDGTGFWGVNMRTYPDAHIQVNLQRQYVINKLYLHPRSGSAGTFPNIFSIQISKDGKTWETVADYSGFSIKNAAQPVILEFDAVVAKSVRVVFGGIKTSVCLSGLGVYGPEHIEINKAYKKENNGKLVMAADIASNIDFPNSAEVVLAAYDSDGKAVLVNSVPISDIRRTKVKTVEAQTEMAVSDDITVKAFLWTTFEDMQPIIPSKEESKSN